MALAEKSAFRDEGFHTKPGVSYMMEMSSSCATRMALAFSVIVPADANPSADCPDPEMASAIVGPGAGWLQT